MFTGITRREQRVLLSLVILIAVGLGIHRCRNRPRSNIELSSPEGASSLKVAPLETDGEDSKTASEPLPPSLIDINTAALEELTSLRYIGPTKAKSIIDYRTECGGFRSIDELTGVNGIGEATLARIRDNITVGDVKTIDPTPLTPPETESEGGNPAVSSLSPPEIREREAWVNINTAGPEELMTLKLIGEIKARRIMDYRRRYGSFRSPRDLMKVKGIGEKTYQLNRDRITVKGPGG